MNVAEAQEIYSYHVKRTEDLMNSMGEDPQRINALITHTYANLSEKEPAFLWFSVGTLVSSAVGKNLDFAKQAFVNSGGQTHTPKVILDSLSKGNQKIFKDILPLFLTCQQIGIEGIKLLITTASKYPDLLEALEGYTLLQSHQTAMATSSGLSLNEPTFIQQFFSDENNKELAHSVAMGIAKQEQEIVQNMYKAELTEIMLDPTLSSVGHLFQLDEIRILDNAIVFSDYVDDPADIDQRLNLAEVLFKAVEETLSQGQFAQYQAQVLQAAAQTLWSGNPYVSALQSSEANEAYWGQQAEEFDQALKDKVNAFFNDEASPETLANLIDMDEQSLLSSLLTGEHAITKIHFDPLALFLANNPSYAVIAHDINELMASDYYNRTSLYEGGRWTGVALWKPDTPYLQNETHLAIYDTGEYRYYQPYGEVRGITFPFLYDTNTGIPLTKPLYNDLGHYDHTPTMEAIYNNPQVFSTPGHINWYNPYWDQVVEQAYAAIVEQYYKSITVDRIMNMITAPSSYSFEIASKGKSQISLNPGDLFQPNYSNNIDFSSLKSQNLPMGPSKLVVSMELSNGSTFEINDQGNFSCINCTGPHFDLLESAVNAMVHQTFG